MYPFPFLKKSFLWEKRKAYYKDNFLEQPFIFCFILFIFLFYKIIIIVFFMQTLGWIIKFA